MTIIRKPALHYAWILLAAACILSIISRADSASFAVLVDPLAEKFGWKRGDIGLAYSLAFLCSMPAMLVFGWLGDRCGARTLMLGASIMISAGTVMLGMIEQLWHLYVLYGVFGGALGNDFELGARGSRRVALQPDAGRPPGAGPVPHQRLDFAFEPSGRGADLSLSEVLARSKVEWHGVRLGAPDWSADSRSLAVGLSALDGGARVHCLYNAYWEPVPFELPPADGGWRLLVDTAMPSPDDARGWEEALPVEGRTYLAQPRSVVVLGSTAR